MRSVAAPVLMILPLLAASPPDLEQARKLYQMTDYTGSLAILQTVQPRNAPVLEMMGRDYYMQGEFKKASEQLEKALAAEPSNSDYALWLGRAYGRRAETASPFTAPGQASKARQYFEKAVQLDPHNKEALSDLFEYYLEAPGFMGGGLEKANATANQIAAIDPVEGHWAQARIAEKKKEYGSAEAHFQRAAEMAPQQIGRLLDLARFLAKQGRIQESDQHLHKAELIAPDSPQVMYTCAELYIREGRNLNVARELLRRYLAAPLTPDDPPRADAEKLLKKVNGV